MNKHIQLTSCFILLASYLLFLTSCNQNRNKNKLSNNNKQQITIHRYEQALFRLNPDNLKQGLPLIQKEYKFFLGDNINDAYNLKQLSDYLKDPVIKEAYNDCMKTFPKIDDIEKQFSDAFTIYKNLYPIVKIPQIFTYVSGFDFENPVKYSDSIIVIALDMYLGPEYPNYSKLSIPEYIRKRFSKDYIVRDCMTQLALNISSNHELRASNLLDIMIQKGKVLYFVQTVLPDMSEEINIKYSKEQLDWCKANESNLWAFLIYNKLLFNTDNNTIIKFTGDAPFTSAISREAPGRIGEWFGWQIVKAYMKNNKNITLPILMNDNNSQQILNNSGYKPGKT